MAAGGDRRRTGSADPQAQPPSFGSLLTNTTIDGPASTMRFPGIVVASAAALLLICLGVQASASEEKKRKSFIRDKSQAQRRTQEGGDGGIFSNTAFCPESSSNQYQTERVWSLLAGLYQLVNPSSLRGTCASFCAQICNHQPCIRDFEAPDAELCTCFSDAISFCGENTNCDFRTDTCFCQDGYSGDPLIGCIDDDECISDPCGPNGECRNTPGSFSCDCFDGYGWDEPDGGCQDINECDNVDSPCGPNASCDNTVGSFTCECDPNYTGNPPSTFCSDIDECTSTENLCGANGQCINVPGSYQCNCNPGYESVAPNGGCINVDECSDNTDSCDDTTEVCTDTTGSFLCSCKDGFQGTAPGSCVDFDECVDATICGDNASCENTFGSYECSCDPGFPAGGPPNCRKAVEYEGCPSGTDYDCASGLTCADTSRSDSKPSCCPLTERCKVSQKCCNGFYTNGQECPSGLDVDCRGDLVCGKSVFGFGPLVCCTFAVDDLLSETKTCLL